MRRRKREGVGREGDVCLENGSELDEAERAGRKWNNTCMSNGLWGARAGRAPTSSKQDIASCSWCNDGLRDVLSGLLLKSHKGGCATSMPSPSPLRVAPLSHGDCWCLAGWGRRFFAAIGFPGSRGVSQGVSSFLSPKLGVMSWTVGHRLAPSGADYHLSQNTDIMSSEPPDPARKALAISASALFQCTASRMAGIWDSWRWDPPKL